MKTRSTRYLAVLTTAALVAAPLRAQTTILTYSTPTSGGVGFTVNVPPPPGLLAMPAGEGQTFVTPGGSPSALVDFSFWLRQGETSSDVPGLQGSVPFVAQLYRWGGSAPVGPALFTSPIATAPPLVGPETFLKYTFPTGGLLLQPNTSYLALLTSLGVPNDGLPRLLILNVADTGDDPYPPGLRVTQYQTLDMQQLLWATLAEDYMFEARLVATPEPATLALAGPGLLGIGCLLRRFKRYGTGSHPTTR